jgi:CheY-like chemotaxis protein
MNKPISKIKVLVIDDDELVRMAVTRMLQKQGYEVLEAKNGVVGIEMFKSHQPDIILTDMLMPDKEGLETISEILQLRPNTKIIAMSGGGQSQNMSFLQLARKIGASRTISKPVKPDELFSAIKSLG